MFPVSDQLNTMNPILLKKEFKMYKYGEMFTLLNVYLNIIFLSMYSTNDFQTLWYENIIMYAICLPLCQPSQGGGGNLYI